VSGIENVEHILELGEAQGNSGIRDKTATKIMYGAIFERLRSVPEEWTSRL
jgi:hypothetical protein